jgi:hypothetical protein
MILVEKSKEEINEAEKHHPRRVHAERIALRARKTRSSKKMLFVV